MKNRNCLVILQLPKFTKRMDLLYENISEC